MNKKDQISVLVTKEQKRVLTQVAVSEKCSRGIICERVLQRWVQAQYDLFQAEQIKAASRPS